MNELESVLRAKYRQPRDLVRALGLDEVILREPKKPASAIALDEAMRAGMQKIVSMGQDATLQDFVEFIDMLKSGNSKGAAHEAAELAEEVGAEENEEREELDEDDNDGEAGEKEDNDMEDNSGLPAFAEEREEKKAKDEGGLNHKVASLLMEAAKMLMGEGREEEPAKDEEIDATDCAAKDEDLEGIGEKPAKDEEPKGLKEKAEKDLITKPAMDAAISAAVKAAEKRSHENAKAIRAAERAVRPYVGELAMDAASPDEVYRKALGMMGVEGVDTVHASALPILLKTLPLPGSNAAPRREAKIAQDAAAVDARAKRFPALARIAH